MTTGGTIILLYHRVAQLAHDPHGLAVRPDRFAQHCDVLRRRCEVVPLDEMAPARRQVVITFDDGYADNAGDARRILAEAGLPATFFITTGWLGQAVEAWWDRLAYLLLDARTAAQAIETTIDGRRLWADLRSEQARDRAHMALFCRLRPLRPAAIAETLRAVATDLGVPDSARHTHRWMTPDELRALADTRGMHIGAHTVTHARLSGLPPEDQRTEIAASRADLERLLGRPVTAFSYPFGGPDAFNEITRRCVQEAGFTMACNASGGVVRPADDRYSLHRNVVGDWEAEQFDEWLGRWLKTP
jgi:peptidoglycan/xylan/chitin deacetylase (PgdA/CDA1 family)